jgi:murein DD-endopeptidase MepM/ murein hydrolase activator NlpD
MKQLKSPIARYKDEPIFITLPYGDKSFVDTYRRLGWNLTHHNGIDLTNSVDPQKAYGTPVYASQDGVVQNVIYDTSVSTKGNGITIEGLPFWQGDKRMILAEVHWHLAEASVKAGDFVKAGQKIGKLGNTGFAVGGQSSPFRGTHNHFMVYPYQMVGGSWQKTEPNNGVSGAVDPIIWLEKDWQAKAQVIEYDKKQDMGTILGIIKRSLDFIFGKVNK